MAQIPLRLRRRRDGSLALTDAGGAIATDGREFPTPHLFVFGWLYGEGSSVAKVDGDRLTLTLANAEAVYRVVPNDDPVMANQGVLCELDAVELFDPEPIDEQVAAARAAEYAERERLAAIAKAKALIEAEGTA